MSDIGLDWGNFFDLTIGGACLLLALVLIGLGLWLRRRWLPVLAACLAMGTGIDLLHSFAYAKPSDRPLTLASGVGALIFAVFAAWIACMTRPRAEKPR